MKPTRILATGDAFSCMIQVAGTTARYRVARDKAKERELDRQNFKIQEPTLENDARVARWRNARFEIQAERDAEGGPTAVRAAKAVVEQRHEERRRAGRAAGFEGPTRQAVPRTELEIADSVADVQGLSRTVAEGLSVAECGDEEWDVEEGYLLVHRWTNVRQLDLGFTSMRRSRQYVFVLTARSCRLSVR